MKIKNNGKETIYVGRNDRGHKPIIKIKSGESVDLNDLDSSASAGDEVPATDPDTSSVD